MHTPWYNIVQRKSPQNILCYEEAVSDFSEVTA